MDKHNLNSLNPGKFSEFMKSRGENIAKATDTIPTDIPAVNKLAKLLHPKEQRFTVDDVIEHNSICRSYVLKAEDGCAYFIAGQYVTVFVTVDGKTYSRPYSVSTSPKDSLKGIYRITVKAVEGGIVSDYIFENFKVGTQVITSDPRGNFIYEPLRDSSHVLGIAGGSGITPFISMAKAIAEGDEDFSLTILYGCKTEEEILFKDELDALCNSCEKIKVVYVLSEEDKPQFEKGFINERLIRKYIYEIPSSVFICGPQAMISFVKSELEGLELERKYIRSELPGELFMEEYGDEVVKITVNLCGEKRVITAKKSESILRSLEENSINPPSGCRSGECGFCRSRLIAGDVKIPDNYDMRRMADLTHGYIHPCSAFPLTDIEIEVFPK